MFYFRSLEACSIFKAKPEPFEEGRGYYATGAETRGRSPDTGYLNAFDLNTLDFAWRYQLLTGECDGRRDVDGERTCGLRQ